MGILSGEEFVIFDVETTGLSPVAGDRIIEVAALRIIGGKPAERFHSLVNPLRPISYGAYCVNQISQEMVEDAPVMPDILPDLLAFIGDRCIVGHNINFDLDFLSSEAAREMIPFEKKDMRFCDTMRMARGVLPGLPKYSLAYIAQYTGFQLPQQHRAMADVQMTFEIFCKLVDQAQKSGITSSKILISLYGSLGKDAYLENNKKMSVLNEAIAHNQIVEIQYYGAQLAQLTTRHVTPKKIVKDGSRSVLNAFCHLRNEERKFRLDRIVALEIQQ